MLIGALRVRGLPVSVAEAIDAAAAAAVVGVDRGPLAEALAAALVKDEGDRALFDECFAQTFPAPTRAAARRARGRRPAPVGGEGGSESSGGEAASTGGGPPRAAASGPSGAGSVATDASPGRGDRTDDGDERESTGRPATRRDAGVSSTERDPRDDHSGSEGAASAHRRAAARRRALRTMPFASMAPGDVEEAAALARVLARQATTRLRRRLQPRRAGRLDFRRTLRAATSRGGVALERYFRGRRPRRPALVALCDLSVSTASATEFFLGLLVPARAHFARVRLFGFVDRLVEIEFVDGRVRPAGPIDLMARSDFGRVLRDLMGGDARDLTADTVLLILGDARNNRRPPRADLLRLARARVRRVVWLNPEPAARWNTGDSVIDAYARCVDVVVPCGSLTELAAAVIEVARRA